jgi:hypothetical protein
VAIARRIGLKIDERRLIGELAVFDGHDAPELSLLVIRCKIMQENSKV